MRLAPKSPVSRLGALERRIPGIYHWFHSMDLQLTQRSSTAAAVPMHNDDRVIETSIPARLDSLSWSSFHTRVVLALGITWKRDGLKASLEGTFSGRLRKIP